MSKVPGFNEFPNFLKRIESKWKMKLMRRFERERYIGTKDVSSNQSRPPPRYILSMFPYPSGRLHLGHVRIYTSGDILAKYSKLMSKNVEFSTGYDNVINPMGFDSFGLPAENAAKERGLNPAIWTNSNVRSMKQQLDNLGLQFDWREATSNPSFYKWTQEIFLRLMDAGLVYKSFAQVNWDPIDKTVLADEQVDEEGRSWRSGALIEKRNYRQWFIKVNAFTNNIYNAEDVDPESWKDILAIQRNWIGEPCGWLFYLPIARAQSSSSPPDILPIFTKKPELFTSSDTRLVISNDHWLEKIHRISQTGYIDNPFTGGILKISLTDNIEDLPANSNATLMPPIEHIRESSPYKNLNREQVIFQAKLNGLGGYYTSDRYRDWLISRQRFWGTPIPVVRCDGCGYKGVPKESLPITLPAVENLNRPPQANESSKTDELQVTSPIEELAPIDWLETKCPSCGSKALRECETFDTLFDSSWYFLRYATDPPNDQPYDPERVQPVWCYIGGKEHASMHLFYARFITHFLHSQGQLKFKEPFNKLLVQGVVKSRTYKLNGRYLSQSEVDSLDDKSELTVDYEKMSKSKGNGVDPQDLLDTYGMDATRFCLMSYANPISERLWRNKEEEFKDVISYLRRVVLTVQEYIDNGNMLLAKKENQGSSKVKELGTNELELRKSLLVDQRNRCSIDAIFHIQETNQFRQFISVLHVLLNSIRSNLNNSVVYTQEFAEALASLIVMLSPLTPHLSEELWLHFSNCVINPLRSSTSSPYKTLLQASDQPWPIPDNNYPLQVKVRAFNTDEYIDKIQISKEDLKSLKESDIARLVESHFMSKGDACKVNEVQKFNDLMAIVVANVESINRKMADKRQKKKGLKS